MKLVLYAEGPREYGTIIYTEVQTSAYTCTNPGTSFS